MQLSIISPEKIIFKDTVEMAVVPGSKGDFGILENHAPFMTTLRRGTVTVYNNGTVDRIFTLTGGFAEVTTDGCIILADSVETVDQEPLLKGKYK